MTTVWSLIAATVVWAVVASMIGERMTWPVGEVKIGMPFDSGSRTDFSASICMTTRPSGLMRGVTPRMMPTLFVVMVFVLPVVALIVIPEIVGTRCPTWMKAGWLSRVMTCGRCRTST